jgi:hypothetical protein
MKAMAEDKKMTILQLPYLGRYTMHTKSYFNVPYEFYDLAP